MVKKFSELSRTTVGPEGNPLNLRLAHILDGDAQMSHMGRVFAFATLPVGGGIPLHPHNGESETYFFLSGTGVFNDNGTLVPVGKGDVAHTPSGSKHGIQNTGEVPLEYITLVLYHKD